MCNTFTSSQLKNFTLLEFCELGNEHIPRFCYHEALSVAGNCRICLVELTFAAKPIASCAMNLADIPQLNVSDDGDQVPSLFLAPSSVLQTNTWLVKRAREGVLEFLLINHPLDCPICDQAGECDLQDQALIFGSDLGRFYDYKRSTSDKNCGPLIKTIMTRCIHCTRCVRFASEIAGVNELGVVGRGFHMEIGFYIDQLFSSELSGNLIDLCPVGALTSKPYAFTARPWELDHFYSVDIFDNMHSPISLDVVGSQILRIVPRSVSSDSLWITDRIRFSYDGFFNSRLLSVFSKKLTWFNFSISAFASFLSIPTSIFSFYYMYVTQNLLPYKLFFCLPSFNPSSFSSSLHNLNLRIFKLLFNVKKVHFNKLPVYTNINNFYGLKSYQVYKNFTEVIGSLKTSLFSKWDLSFRSNYLMSPSSYSSLSSSLRSWVLVNNLSDFRLDVPLFHLFLRKQVIKAHNNVFILGSPSKFNFYSKQIGISWSDLINFLCGSHWICSFLSSRPSCILNFSQRLDISIYSKLLPPNIIPQNISLHTGSITDMEFGDTTTHNLNNSAIFAPNSIDFSNSNNSAKTSSISIFHGSHLGSSFLNSFHFLFPSLIFLERSDLFLNIFGFIRNSNLVFNPQKDILTDSLFFTFFISNLNYSKLYSDSLKSIFFISKISNSFFTPSRKHSSTSSFDFPRFLKFRNSSFFLSNNVFLQASPVMVDSEKHFTTLNINS